MLITTERIGEVAGILLSVLDREGVKNLGDLEALAGQAIPVEGREQDYITVNYRPSVCETRTLSVEYGVLHKLNQTSEGVPLNVKMNRVMEKSTMIIKCKSLFEGYALFAHDSFGNFVQFRGLETTEWAEIRKEIEKLKEVTERKDISW